MFCPYVLNKPVQNVNIVELELKKTQLYGSLSAFARLQSHYEEAVYRHYVKYIFHFRVNATLPNDLKTN